MRERLCFFLEMYLLLFCRHVPCPLSTSVSPAPSRLAAPFALARFRFSADSGHSCPSRQPGGRADFSSGTSHFVRFRRVNR